MKKQLAFGLIEVLVTLGVLSVGILGVASLQGVITRQSIDNKARSEAFQIAQSRMEDMRNYTNSANSVDQFNSLYPDVSNGNPVMIEGTSTAFTRTESIATTELIKEVAVSVSWTDLAGKDQNVMLNTSLSFVAPDSIGSAALVFEEARVDTPAGQAQVGEGVLSQTQLNAAVPNTDGTSEVISGTDRLLAVGNEVVLTLSRACQLPGELCSDFARINGRIWIDQATQPDIRPGQVFVTASGNSFCARHYSIHGINYEVTKETVNAGTTANDDYEYFDYTCYLGGGWHGNVGIFVSNGFSDADSICVGDPTSLVVAEQPSIAARRSYLGMLYKIDTGEPDGKQKKAGSSTTRYYSQGIGSGQILPAPGSDEATHDFVVAANANADICKSTFMMRQDSSSGAVFSRMPGGFYCLNDGLLDEYDETVFGHEPACPYDPANP